MRFFPYSNTFCYDFIGKPKELKIKKVNDKFWIVRKNGGNAIYIGHELYECEKCDQIFPYKSEFERHHAVKHSTERPFECWLCHKM